MKALHTVLVGLITAVLTAIGGFLGHFDASSVTANPFLVLGIGAAVAALTALVGNAIAKLGTPPPQTLVEAQKVMAQQSAAQSRGR